RPHRGRGQGRSAAAAGGARAAAPGRGGARGRLRRRVRDDPAVHGGRAGRGRRAHAVRRRCPPRPRAPTGPPAAARPAGRRPHPRGAGGPVERLWEPVAVAGPRPPAAAAPATPASSVLDGLDHDQRAAALAPDGPLLIVAGPGTGKTRTLTHLLAHRVAERG